MVRGLWPARKDTAGPGETGGLLHKMRENRDDPIPKTGFRTVRRMVAGQNAEKKNNLHA